MRSPEVARGRPRLLEIARDHTCLPPAKPKPKTTEELRAQLETIQAALVADPGNAQQTALKGEVVTALKARLEEVMAKLENDADNEEMLTLAADLEEVIENAEK